MLYEVRFHGNVKSVVIDQATRPDISDLYKMFKQSIFTFEEFIESQAITCNCCGHKTMSKYNWDRDQLYIEKDTLCHDCGFWLTKAALHKQQWEDAIPVLCDSGEHYIIRNPTEATVIRATRGLGVGHGGMQFTIEIYAGDYIGTWHSNNVWSQGQPPEHLKHLFINLGRVVQ